MISRRRLFALGGAAAVAPMLPSVAQAAEIVAPVVVNPVTIPPPWFWGPPTHFNCRCVLTVGTVGA